MALQRRLTATYSCCRGLVASSFSTFQQQTSSFHSSALTSEKKAKKVARLKKKANLDRRQTAAATLAATAPDPVRGYGPNNEQIWLGCELKKILLDSKNVWKGEYGEKRMLADLEDARAEELGPRTTELEQIPVPSLSPSPSSSASPSSTAPTLPAPSSSSQRTPYLNFGLGPSDGTLLLHKLPASTAFTSSSARRFSSSESDTAEAKEAEKADSLSRIIDLRNANARGIRFENTRRILRRFGQNQGTGRPEFQAAVLTMRIHTVADRRQEMPRDVHSKRSLRALVMQRATVLKYLKKHNLERYVQCLKDIGVEQRAVEGEIIVR